MPLLTLRVHHISILSRQSITLPAQTLPTQGWPAAHHLSLQSAALQASQEFDPAERTVINQAQLIGDRLFVTASGTYEPLVGSWMHP